MKWVLIGVFGFFWLFSLLVRLGAALYDPGTGTRLPEKGKPARILMAILEGLLFIFTL